MPNPSVSDYLNASNYAYARNSFVPPGFTPLVDRDTGPVVSEPNGNGVYGVALVNSSGQVIIAFEGTDPNNSGSFGADARILGSQSLPGNEDAMKFADFAARAASKQGYSKDNIFVTGHSLGGLYAEYVAKQFDGLGGGAAFGAPGLPDHSSAPSSTPAVANFTNYIHYGDGVGNYGSDTAVGRALGMSNRDHVGSIQFLGNPARQRMLVNAALGTTPSTDLEGANFLYGLGGFLGQIGDHFQESYAGNLSTPLQDSSVVGQPGVKDFSRIGGNGLASAVQSPQGLVQNIVTDPATGARSVEVAGIPVYQARPVPAANLAQTQQLSPNEVVKQEFDALGSSAPPTRLNYNDFGDPSLRMPMLTTGTGFGQNYYSPGSGPAFPAFTGGSGGPAYSAAQPDAQLPGLLPLKTGQTAIDPANFLGLLPVQGGFDNSFGLLDQTSPLLLSRPPAPLDGLLKGLLQNPWDNGGAAPGNLLDWRQSNPTDYGWLAPPLAPSWTIPQADPVGSAGAFPSPPPQTQMTPQQVPAPPPSPFGVPVPPALQPLVEHFFPQDFAAATQSWPSTGISDGAGTQPNPAGSAGAGLDFGRWPIASQEASASPASPIDIQIPEALGPLVRLFFP